MRDKRVILLLRIFIGLILLQLFRIMFHYIIFLFIKKTDFSDHMANAVFMVFFYCLMVVVTRKKGISLSVFTGIHSILYIIATVFTIILLLSTPIIIGDRSFSYIALLIYSSIIIPVFEETLFRGIIWDRLLEQFHKTLVVYIISTVIFALWHLGYVDSIVYRMNLYDGIGIINIMFWKVITGLCYGIVLGAVRCKTKNCYSTMLLHGVLNLFAR